MNKKLTPKEFCIWLSGFVNASHHWNLTPEAWENVKDVLRKINYEEEDNYKYEYTKNQTTTLGPKKEILND